MMYIAISGDGTKIFSTNFFLSAGQPVCRVEEFVRDINSFPSTPTHSYLCDTSDQSDMCSYRDWETDRKSTRLNSSHRSLSRMPSSA